MKLVINADDYGYTRSVTEGIVEGYKKGIIRSTTALSNSKYLEYGAELAKECPDLGIGVHLTLTLGKSLTGVKTFTDETGEFLSQKLIRTTELDMDEVYEEWKAQIERFIAVFGRKPDHLDSHHSVHDFNEKQKAVAFRLAEEYGLQLRRYSDFKYVAGFYGPTTTREVMCDIIKENKDEYGIEIMTHPGFCDLDLYRMSSYNTNRVVELDVLCSEEVKKCCEEYGVTLANYGSAKE